MRALLLLLVLLPGFAGAGECVVLLHGLARTDASMADLAEALADAGYEVANINYPSRDYVVPELADRAVVRGVEHCAAAGDPRPHFVTHSLGGILVRSYYHREQQARPERVVMLAPPNRGSQVVDELQDMPGFDLWNGPAGDQLGTGAGSVPSRLPPVDFPTGIIAGTDSINLILSNFLPDPDDGKVALSRARVKGMTACIALPVTHTFMMLDDEVIRQTLHFLDHGSFDRRNGIPPTCDRILEDAAVEQEP